MNVEVALVDAGSGNLGSLAYALERLGARVLVSDDARAIAGATHVILPGVGAAKPAMRALRAKRFDEVLHSLRQPLLGVCLGMQLLFERSEEGDVKGLGLLRGTVRRLKSNADCRVPHMGWNEFRICRDDPLFAGLSETNHYAYFVHGYAAPESSETLAVAEHSSVFSAVVRHGNLWGMQFHPERSAAVGHRLLANFLAL